jgi:hypothetical protein
LVGKPEGKRTFGRRRSGWEDNIKMDFREREWVLTRFIWLKIETSGVIF